MEKRALLAIVLSLLVIMLYQWYMGTQHTTQMPMQEVLEDTSQKFTDRSDISPLPQTTASVSLPAKIKEKEIIIETDKFLLTFTNIGGAIKKVELKDYPDSKTNKPLNLATAESSLYNIGAIREFYPIPNSEIVPYVLTREANQVIYSYATQNFAIEKRYNLHNSMNHIELSVTIKNLTEGTVNADYIIIGASGIDKSEAFASRYIEVDSKVNGRIIRDKKNSVRLGEVLWVALKNKYFDILLKPYQVGKSALIERTEEQNLSVGLKTPQFAIPARGQTSQQYLYYIGPNDTQTLKEYGMGLEDIVSYGIFSGISKILLTILIFFHKIFRNWGLAIICVTFLINIVLFPLSKKSYRSMKQVQELQPHIEKLRQLHKDNPQKLQKEMMELYRTYRVNPMGGCLPLLLQMPIIIAMYQTIMRSIELKGANFLWIKDLSQPDAVALPFSLPILGNTINILPVLMMVAMVVQQKISPLSKGQAKTEQQKQQQTMMLFMPILFGIIFYSLPSGLVLYWLINTILMMINQHRVMKTTPSLAEG